MEELLGKWAKNNRSFAGGTTAKIMQKKCTYLDTPSVPLVPLYRSAAGYNQFYTHQKVIAHESKGHRSKCRSLVSIRKNAKQTKEKQKVISASDTQEYNKGIQYLRLSGKNIKRHLINMPSSSNIFHYSQLSVV